MEEYPLAVYLYYVFVEICSGEDCRLIILSEIAPNYSLRTRFGSPELKSFTTEARTSRGTLLVRLYLVCVCVGHSCERLRVQNVTGYIDIDI